MVIGFLAVDELLRVPSDTPLNGRAFRESGRWPFRDNVSRRGSRRLFGIARDL
jgi:hypothetical protein